jgi:hypothetical protein
MSIFERLSAKVLNEKSSPEKSLNSDLWEDDKLKPEVRNRLMQISQNFYTNLGLEAKAQDVMLTGSMANYNYNRLSDIDVHIILDFSDINEDKKLVDKMLKSRKAIWNDQHDIMIKGHEVELYVQDLNEPHIASGTYSIQNDEWINRPDPSVEHEIDKWKVFQLSDQIRFEIDDATENDNLERLNDIWEKIKKLRKEGLHSENAEFSEGNLIFKSLRNTGYLEKVNEARARIYDKQMSLEKRKRILKIGV